MKTALGFDGTLKFRMTIIIDGAPKGFDLYDAGLPDEVDDIYEFMNKLKHKGVKCHLQHTVHDEILNGDETNYEWDDIFNINEEDIQN